MKKRILCCVIVIMTIALAVGLMAACSPQEEHEHTFAESWESDATGHWHKATCEHSELKDGFAAHLDENSDNKCDVCDYDMTPAVCEHPYDADRWLNDSDTHWNVPLCEHTNERPNEAPHIDEDNDNKCDVCDYDMTPAACEHPYDAEQWLYDSDTHWNLPLCEHTEERPNEAPHVDEDKDGKCDVCKCSMAVHQHVWGDWQSDENEHWRECSGCEERSSEGPHIDENDDEVCDTCQAYVPHKHTFGEEYGYDENEHWNIATCKHPEEKGNVEDHDFVDGECVCGAKENYANVFKAMKEQSLIAAKKDYKTWLSELSGSAVTNVRITAAGDIIYEYSDRVEYKYFGERTVVIRAVTTDGKPLQDVWFKLSCKIGTGSRATYVLFADDRTDAITIAKTNESGYAEFKFKPLTEYGYSSTTVSYDVRLAEAKDMAVALNNDEEDNSPIPVHYVVNGYAPKESAIITESDVGEITAGDGECTFKFSQAWSDSKQTLLPYARYYAMAASAIGLTEVGKTYTFTSSGNKLYDYFYFVPGQVPHGEYSDPAKEETALANAKHAAAGYYTISFEIDGSAEGARLYYWSVDIDLFANQNADGSPRDTLATSISGDIYDGFNEAYAANKFTHENSIKITVTTALALSQYQIGFISDTPCNVTLTISHDSDYDEEALIPVIGLGESKSVALHGLGEPTPFNFGEDITAGAYMLEVTATYAHEPQMNLITGKIDNGKKILLWSEGAYKCLVEIPSGAKKLYLMFNTAGSGSMAVKIKLTKYESAPEIKLNAEGPTTAWVPVVCGKSSSFKVNLDTSAVDPSKKAYVLRYKPTVHHYGQGTPTTAPKAVNATMTYGDGKTISFQPFDGTQLQEAAINDISELNGDLTFFCDNPEYSLIMAQITIEPIRYAELDTEYNSSDETSLHIQIYTGVPNAYSIRVVAFTATEAGTYKITIPNANSTYSVANVDDPQNRVPIIAGDRNGEDGGDKSGTFELQAGETILLGIYNSGHSSVKYTITRES